MTDSQRDSDQKPPDEGGANREKSGPAPFWRSWSFAIVAVLIALIGMVWRCA
jgi:hypothetical protein